ncbi:MAG TPA: Rap1a/Tai family immunity protein [Alphaproteobacteria bacterium]|jgi:hypothetical protein
MRNRILLLAAVAAFSMISFPAQAARFSGAYLYQICNMDKNGKEIVKGGHTACQAYIAGVIDYHTLLQSMKIAPKIDICIPTNTPSATLHAVVLKYLAKNNTHDEFVAAPAVTMALYGAYPCKRGK